MDELPLNLTHLRVGRGFGHLDRLHARLGLDLQIGGERPADLC
jgi:hypothetical protein